MSSSAPTSDPIADFLTRLRNAGRAKLETIKLPHSQIKAQIARVLKKEGYITDFSVENVEGSVRKTLVVKSKYVNGTFAIAGLKRLSKPGLRRYVGAKEIPRVLGGAGISILSTPVGILSGREARRQNVGGELLALVY
jgi:small subunit ribosomal protein S8